MSEQVAVQHCLRCQHEDEVLLTEYRVWTESDGSEEKGYVIVSDWPEDERGFVCPNCGWDDFDIKEREV